MECRITFSIECDKETEQKIRGLVETFGQYDKAGSKLMASDISSDFAEHIEGLYDEYGEKLENMKSWGKKTFQIRSTGGSDSEDFIYDFMEALGPHVDVLKGSYRHDDEDGLNSSHKCN